MIDIEENVLLLLRALNLFMGNQYILPNDLNSKYLAIIILQFSQEDLPKGTLPQDGQ